MAQIKESKTEFQILVQDHGLCVKRAKRERERERAGNRKRVRAVPEKNDDVCRRMT